MTLTEFVLTVLVFAVIALGSEVRELHRQVRRLMAMVKPEALEPSESVVDLVRNGQTLVAIKRYRDETGASLREAKDRIDAVVASIKPT